MRKVNVNSYGFDKMYLGKDLIEDDLYEIIHQFSERKITSVKVYSILLNEIHPFYEGHGRTCKIIFVYNDKINKLCNGAKG